MHIFQFKAPIDVSSPTISNTIQQHFFAAKLLEVSAMDHSTGRSLISLGTKPYFPIESWLFNDGILVMANINKPYITG